MLYVCVVLYRWQNVRTVDASEILEIGTGTTCCTPNPWYGQDLRRPTGAVIWLREC